MATSTKQYELYVAWRVSKPHFYWSRKYRQWMWDVSSKACLNNKTFQLCNSFCRHLNKVSRPI